MIARLLLGSLVALAPSLALAACEKGTETVFSCLTSRGKQIEVCDSGKTIDYSFGVPGRKPEIVVRALRKDASTRQWKGIGRNISYSVQVPNGNTVYDVFWGMDRLDDKHPDGGGVTVVINGREEASVHCASGKPIVQNMEGIKLRELE